MSHLPPIRATFLDLDGLLIDSEHTFMVALQNLLTTHSCPPMPAPIIVSTFGNIALRLKSQPMKDWIAQNALSDVKWRTQEEFEGDLWKHCSPARLNAEMMDGAEDLLRNLIGGSSPSRGMDGDGMEKLEVAIISNTTRSALAIKCSRNPIFALLPSSRKLTRDDPRLATHNPPIRPKPAPDLYLTALSILNQERSKLHPPMTPLQPNECLVFEDSVIGVEAARKAGMRVVWVPHPLTRSVYRGLEADVLAGKSGESGEEGGDYGMAEMRDSLVGFGYERYGIVVSGSPN